MTLDVWLHGDWTDGGHVGSVVRGLDDGGRTCSYYSDVAFGMHHCPIDPVLLEDGAEGRDEVGFVRMTRDEFGKKLDVCVLSRIWGK